MNGLSLSGLAISIAARPHTYTPIAPTCSHWTSGSISKQGTLVSKHSDCKHGHNVRGRFVVQCLRAARCSAQGSGEAQAQAARVSAQTAQRKPSLCCMGMSSVVIDLCCCRRLRLTSSAQRASPREVRTRRASSMALHPPPWPDAPNPTATFIPWCGRI